MIRWRRSVGWVASVGLWAACSSSNSPNNQDPAAAIAANSAVIQTGLAGAAVGDLPSVLVTDAQGDSVAGIEVVFSVTGGGGSITGATSTTNDKGIATLGSWKLGPGAGAQTVQAVANGVSLSGDPVVFTVDADAAATPFTIDLQFRTVATAAQRTAFFNARARWQQVISADIPDISLAGNTTNCGGVVPRGTVDDVRILVELDSIDGVGNILGSAGPCIIRFTSRLTAVGVMRFDTADLATLQNNGSLGDVILHEMGHVLGYGTLWDQPQFNYLNGACTSSQNYDGALAVAAFTGSNGGVGSTIPVENFQPDPQDCNNGTRDSHWEEDVFKSEIMTGFISGTVRPLSLTSIQSLADLGYTVNTNAADPFNINTQPTLRAGQATQPILADLRNDIRKGPIYTVDDRGRVEFFRDRK